MHQVHLLKEIRNRHQEGVVDLHAGALVYEVGPKNREDEVLEILELEHGQDCDECGYILDLVGIMLLSPSAATAVAAAACRAIQSYRVPVVLMNAEPEVLQGLMDCRYIRENATPPLPVLDSHGQPTYVASMPDRWRNLLESLPSDGATASTLAGGGSASKKDVNRYSVYLQELYSNGLARREKIPGSERDGGERGWTYVYYPVQMSVIRSSVEPYRTVNSHAGAE